MVNNEAEKQKFIVKKIGRNSGENPDEAIGRRAADRFFDRLQRRSDVKRLLKKLS